MSDLVRVPGAEGRHGRAPGDRSVPELLANGLVALDKPQGPTSHQVSAWVRDMVGAPQAGHGGTLDPRVTGVLPVALGDATRALDALLVGDKEYVGVMQLHQDMPEARVREMMGRFVGELFQTPPVRAAVKRQLRTRHVYELEPLEFDGRLVLFRTRCESGTYVRTLCNDLGEALGVGANMIDLRRTRTAELRETDIHPVIALRDAFHSWKEAGEEGPLRGILRPMETLLAHLPAIVIKDTAVDALCHGANLAVKGIVRLDASIRKGALVAVFTLKGEGVALADALMPAQGMFDAESGVAADVNRVLMRPGTYPKLWR
jgi:H/ACA ribonucleoprotein complex subunit 4